MPRHDGMGSKGAPPAPRLVVKTSAFDHPKSDIAGYVRGHPFNNAMELLLPVPAGSKSSQCVITNTDALGCPQPFFQSFEAPLSMFATPQFLSSYVKTSVEFLALSTNTPIDRTDAVALSPDGRLHLALTKESYETLGLVGTTSAFQPRERHNVTIDLRAKSFVPGRKLHDRVQECLGRRTGSLEFLGLCIKDGKPLEVADFSGVMHSVQMEDRTVEDLQLPVMDLVRGEPLDAAQPMDVDWGASEPSAWEDPPGASIAHSSAGFIPLGGEEPREKKSPGRKGVGGQRTGLKTSGGGQRHERKAAGGESGDLLTDTAFLLAMHEWIGAVACGLAGTAVRTDLSGTRVEPEQAPPSRDWFADSDVRTQAGGAKTVRWSGLIAPSQVLNCLALMRRLIEEQQVPWAVLTVWGFADSPVSWHGAEHGFALGGENDYSIVVFRDDRYLLYSAACGYDAMNLG